MAYKEFMSLFGYMNLFAHPTLTHFLWALIAAVQVQARKFDQRNKYQLTLIKPVNNDVVTNMLVDNLEE